MTDLYEAVAATLEAADVAATFPTWDAPYPVAVRIAGPGADPADIAPFVAAWQGKSR